MCIQRCAAAVSELYIEGILPKGPYLPCVSMADRAWQDTLDMRTDICRHYDDQVCTSPDEGHLEG